MNANSSVQGKILTEEDVRIATQQYDVALIYHASLPSQGFHQIDASTFARCHSLQLLDVSGNKLTTLSGLEPVAAQLTFLNAAENSLNDISVLAQCTALEYCHLEGNELASVAALKVLVSLPHLIELVLQRTVSLSETDLHETLLLDNPVCRSVEAYQKEFLKQVPHIRWVDGAPSFVRSKLLASAEATDANEAGREASNEKLLSSAAASQQAVLQKMLHDNPDEGKLRNLLKEASKKCGDACHA
ncbi:hypothetical protein ABL78_0324 [Leptomonas seymouri]|uniref:Leucine-rich repeat and WD repeat-containing protein 1 LRR domain-containing protein n=1 Tax=Leptomonas seymouri TaxID=5684 RepID=A0A0N1PGK7_LEPSE|nr:hypothetical protein ABL78_0324 [Leptomonas seymouri]|eukprot:KPI90564.1 hypothetical protein ABL78_0324 [Leptomonas seymouri]